MLLFVDAPRGTRRVRSRRPGGTAERSSLLVADPRGYAARSRYRRRRKRRLVDKLVLTKSRRVLEVPPLSVCTSTSHSPSSTKDESDRSDKHTRLGTSRRRTLQRHGQCPTSDRVTMTQPSRWRTRTESHVRSMDAVGRRRGCTRLRQCRRGYSVLRGRRDSVHPSRRPPVPDSHESQSQQSARLNFGSTEPDWSLPYAARFLPQRTATRSDATCERGLRARGSGCCPGTAGSQLERRTR